MRSNIYTITGVDSYKKLCNVLFNNPKILLHRQILRSGAKFVAFEFNKVKPFLEDKPELLDKLIALSDIKHECRTCGCHSNYFIPDYRGDYCVSRYTSCQTCYGLDDREYFEIMGADHTDELINKYGIFKGLKASYIKKPIIKIYTSKKQYKFDSERMKRRGYKIDHEMNLNNEELQVEYAI